MTTKQRVVSNPGITINLLTVELVAGIIPHAATGLIIAHYHHNGANTVDCDIYTIAGNATHQTDKASTFPKGCAHSSGHTVCARQPQ